MKNLFGDVFWTLRASLVVLSDVFGDDFEMSLKGGGSVYVFWGCLSRLGCLWMCLWRPLGIVAGGMRFVIAGVSMARLGRCLGGVSEMPVADVSDGLSLEALAVLCFLGGSWGWEFVFGTCL